MSLTPNLKVGWLIALQGCTSEDVLPTNIRQPELISSTNARLAETTYLSDLALDSEGERHSTSADS